MISKETIKKQIREEFLKICPSRLKNIGNDILTMERLDYIREVNLQTCLKILTNNDNYSSNEFEILMYELINKTKKQYAELLRVSTVEFI